MQTRFFFLVAGLILLASQATWATSIPARAPATVEKPVIKVLGFCGVGFHRASDGRCYPNGPISAARHPAPPPPTVPVRPPVVCPEGTHLRSDGQVCTPNY